MSDREKIPPLSCHVPWPASINTNTRDRLMYVQSSKKITSLLGIKYQEFLSNPPHWLVKTLCYLHNFVSFVLVMMMDIDPPKMTKYEISIFQPPVSDLRQLLNWTRDSIVCLCVKTRLEI